MPTLQVNLKKLNLLKLKRTQSQNTTDLYVLNWTSSYDVMLFMCQSHQQHFISWNFNLCDF